MSNMMKLDIVTNSKRNIVSYTLNNLIKLFFPFVLRLLMIQYMGSEYLGLNTLFVNILSVLSLAELGIGSAIIFSMYESTANSDIKETNALLSYYKVIYRLISIIVLVAGIILIPAVPYLVNGSYPGDVNLISIYLIYLGNSFATYSFGVYRMSILSVHQREDVIQNIYSIIYFLTYCIQGYIIVCIKNYYCYALLIPASTIAINIITNHIAKKRYPEYKAEGSISKEKKDFIKQKVKGLVISKLCHVSRNSLDSIFISAFIGLSANAIYSNYYYVIVALTGFLSILIDSIRAGIGNNIQTESVGTNYTRFKNLNFSYNWIVSWCICCMLVFYQDYTSICFGEDLMLYNNSVYLFCLYFFILKSIDMRDLYIDVTGLWYENRKYAFAEMVMNIFLNYLFVRIYGVNGIILATIVSLLINNVFLSSKILYKYYFSKFSIKDYYFTYIHYFIIALFVSIFNYGLCSLIHIENIFLYLLCKLVVCLVIPNSLLLLVYHKNGSFPAFVNLIKLFITKKKTTDSTN